MPKVVDLTGLRFGKLLVLTKLSHSRGGSVLWHCHCDCGNEFQASTRHLNRLNHNVRSCGCDQHRSGVRHHQWKGFGEISGHWWNSHVKHSANCVDRVNVKLSITPEYAYNLFLDQGRRCALSGESLVISNRAAINTASLDRVDNTLGYEDGNVRWLHKTVNMMKRTYGDDYFVEWCNKISRYNKC